MRRRSSGRIASGRPPLQRAVASGRGTGLRARTPVAARGTRVLTESVATEHRGPLAIGLVLATTLIAFEVTAVITALPTVSDELGGDSLYGATLAAYTLANIVSLVAVGGLIDSRGPRLPYAISLVLFSIGLVVAALAPSMWVVLLGRLVQGIGSGGLIPVAYAVINRMWASHEQARIFAWVSAGWVLPSLVAPGLAGWMTNAFGWRSVFLSVLPLVVITATLALPAMHDPSLIGTGDRSSVDNRRRIMQAVRLAAGIGALAIGLQASNPAIGVPVAAVGGILGVRAWRQLSPPGVTRASHGLAAIIACRILATAAFLGVDSFVPLAADRIHGASATVQGFVIIGAAVTWSIGSAIVSKMPRLRPDRSATIGFALIGLGVITTSLVVDSSWPLPVVFATWCFAGLGMGLLFVPTSVAAMTHAEPGRDGVIASQVNLADSVGFSLMGGLGGATVAIADRGAWTLQSALVTNFAAALLLTIVGGLLAHRIRARSGSVAGDSADRGSMRT
ncbi:MAG: hypothetical protein B7C54_12340 [Acidimicrobiales bacterium mtb01]|nr:MFS transporter [Actinomycetota bacterium]TEX45818.1 MAG: hypothetical protein B7C54_12340 [Acidimicrobiales bacterium mtb01]